jgi:hypothetical protein
MSALKCPPHSFANIFPILDPTSVEFMALVDDIKENDLREPITLYEGKVLDGRNRYLALHNSGREIKEDYFRTSQSALCSRPTSIVAILTKAKGRWLGRH